MSMDKRDLVESLQKAFHEDQPQRNTKDSTDVEYKENTNTLFIKKHHTYDIQKEAEKANVLSEEEIFKRLHEERH